MLCALHWRPPICRAHVGQNLVVNARGGAVDQHGDILLSTCADGDAVRKLRHNPLLETLASELRQNCSFVRTEDSAFFGSVIPAQALAAVGNDAFRTRPIVVDAVIQLDANSPLQIVEVKTIAYCPSWYSPH